MSLHTLDRQSVPERTDESHDSMRNFLKKTAIVGGATLGAIVLGSSAYNEAVEAGYFETPTDGLLGDLNKVGDTVTGAAGNAWEGLQARLPESWQEYFEGGEGAPESEVAPGDGGTPEGESVPGDDGGADDGEGVPNDKNAPNEELVPGEEDVAPKEEGAPNEGSQEEGVTPDDGEPGNEEPRPYEEEPIQEDRSGSEKDEPVEKPREEPKLERKLDIEDF